jgi:hypothetical protein
VSSTRTSPVDASSFLSLFYGRAPLRTPSQSESGTGCWPWRASQNVLAAYALPLQHLMNQGAQRPGCGWRLWRPYGSLRDRTSSTLDLCRADLGWQLSAWSRYRLRTCGLGSPPQPVARVDSHYKFQVLAPQSDQSLDKSSRLIRLDNRPAI